MYETPPENEAKRLRAYELYLSATLDGKRRSLRSIAQELGLSLSTIQHYRDKDGWEERLKETLTSTSKAASLTSEAIRSKLRAGLLSGLDALQDIIVHAKRPADQIHAVREMATIAVRFKAVGLSETPTTLPEWKDELPIKAEEWQTPSTSSAADSSMAPEPPQAEPQLEAPTE